MIAIAPLFAEAGMIYFVGSGGSDYLGLVGDASAEVVNTMLVAARDCVPDFLGFLFYLVPDRWRLAGQLSAAANRLDLQMFEEGALLAPRMQMTPAQITLAISKNSLLRHERYFRRHGRFEACHFKSAAEILPQLDEFFQQHMRRWANTDSPSLFHDSRQRTFYRRLVEEAESTGWLRFTTVRSNGTPIAFHFGFNYGGSYLWYKPSFEIGLARHSPGEVLLRQLLLAAAEENAAEFDFGIGDEAFKRRFATSVESVRTWGLYIAKRGLGGNSIPVDGLENAAMSR